MLTFYNWHPKESILEKTFVHNFSFEIVNEITIIFSIKSQMHKTFGWWDDYATELIRLIVMVHQKETLGSQRLRVHSHYTTSPNALINWFTRLYSKTCLVGLLIRSILRGKNCASPVEPCASVKCI